MGEFLIYVNQSESIFDGHIWPVDAVETSTVILATKEM